MKPVLITTQHRGVFGGLIDDDQDLTAKAMPMKNARMAIYWGTDRISEMETIVDRIIDAAVEAAKAESER